MLPFDYHRPETIEAATHLLETVSDACLLAGGMSLIPAMKLRLSSYANVIDINGIPELAGISLDGGRLTVGAMTRHRDVAASEIIRTAIPALANLAAGIGDPLCRNRGTMGGSISYNDPVADYPAGLMGLGATVHTTRRAIPADEFFKGLYETALEPGEIVTKISFPIPEKAGWLKFPSRASRFAVVAVMVSSREDAVRVAVTGAKSCVFRAHEMEDALSRKFSADALNGLSVTADDMNSDLDGDAEYRSNLISVLAKRVVTALS